MHDAIMNFGKQFDYVPEIINKENLGDFKHVVVLGMGGSHLAADVIKNINPKLDIWVHKDYGLPEASDEFFKESLIIASSYSGNTEEIIDGLNTALAKGYASAVIAVGGKLLEIAEENHLPFIKLPDTGIQPRSALGFSVVALSHFLEDKELIGEIETIKGKLNPEEFIEAGKAIADNLKSKVPVVYASRKNFSLANNWKIKFNETGKIPAFFNLFPELNHNEMTGFDINPKNKSLSENIAVIFLKDSTDHPQIQKRFDVTKKMYEDRGVMTVELILSGKSAAEKIFKSLLVADWAAFYTAEIYGSESEQVPMVEEFKKLIQ